MARLTPIIIAFLLSSAVHARTEIANVNEEGEESTRVLPAATIQTDRVCRTETRLSPGMALITCPSSRSLNARCVCPIPRTNSGLAFGRVTADPLAEVPATSRPVHLAGYCGVDEQGRRHFCSDTPQEYMRRCQASGNFWSACRLNARWIESKLQGSQNSMSMTFRAGYDR